MIVIKFALLHYFQHFQEVSVLPQITYGNVALIFLSYFPEYDKNEIFIAYHNKYLAFTIFLGPSWL
jgi:hypothetical protein